MDTNEALSVVVLYTLAGLGFSAGWHAFILISNLISEALTGIGNIISPPEEEK